MLSDTMSVVESDYILLPDEQIRRGGRVADSESSGVLPQKSRRPN